MGAATDCFECTTATDTLTKANTADDFGTCTAAAAAPAAAAAVAGKAALNAACEQGGDNAGCAEGLKCGKVTADPDATPAVVGYEKCVAADACVAPVVCGAMKFSAL